jgi:hypothetical protein
MGEVLEVGAAWAAGASVDTPTADINGRRLLAGSVSSRASLTAALGRPGPRIESQLPGAAAYSHCRPIADIG